MIPSYEKTNHTCFFILLASSKDSSIPDVVVPTPSVTKFTLAVTASEGGSVSNPGDTHNENSNVSVTAPHQLMNLLF